MFEYFIANRYSTAKPRTIFGALILSIIIASIFYFLNTTAIYICLIALILYFLKIEKLRFTSLFYVLSIVGFTFTPIFFLVYLIKITLTNQEPNILINIVWMLKPLGITIGIGLVFYHLITKRKFHFIKIISILSTLGITIGVAALIIVLSVFNGFGSIVKTILINFDPHVRITLRSDDAALRSKDILSLIKNNEDVQSIYPYVEGKSVILKGKTNEVLDIKGIDANDSLDTWGVSTALFAGENDLNDEDGIAKVVIGFPIALRLSARIGDTLIVSSFHYIKQSAINFSLPRTFRLKVTGIYKTNNKDYDASLIFTSFKTGQKILGMKNTLSGYDLRLKDINDSENIRNQLLENVDPSAYSIKTWFDLHKDLYTVMLIERWAAYILLCLIIAVATFNILGSLTMSVIEKKKDIGVMRSMGVSNKSILKIFMSEGLLIGTIGTFAGVILGLFICYLQIEFNFYSLDPSKYIIDALPVKVIWTDLIAIAGMSMLLSFLASLYPAKRASKISVTDAIKWE